MRRLLIALALFAAAPALPAQQTTADSAQVLLDAARVLEREGRTRLARDLFRLITEHYPGTPAATAAASAAQALPEPEVTSFGRTGFYLYHTLYGAFLGLAVPAAFGADGPEPYGAGLLVGAPLGFFGSRAYAKGQIVTDGQAGVISFGSFWGTWQGLGWRAVFEIGDEEVCDEFGCYHNESDTAPWVAAIAGGLTGLATGVAFAQAPIHRGTSTMIFNSALWGSWYGLALGILTDMEDDDLLAATLIGGDVGVLAAIPAANIWKPTPSQVRLASVVGLAGGFAGGGLALLFNVDDDKTAVALAAGGTTIGLIGGAMLAKGQGSDDGGGGADLDLALFNLGDGVRLGFPIPIPSAVRTGRATGRQSVPGVRLTLLGGSF
jgi:hypothetical protein